MIISPQIIFASELGLYENQWVKYKISDIRVQSDNEMLRLMVKKFLTDAPFFGSGSTPIEDIEWYKITIKKIFGTEFILERVIKTYDGREISLGEEKNDVAKRIAAYAFVAPTDLKVGDKLLSNVEQFDELRVKSITKKIFANENFEAFEVIGNKITTDDQNAFEYNYQGFFDKKTGILLQMTLDMTAATTLGSVNASLDIEAIELSKPVFPNISNGGCFIATAAFGSELAPQVQMLRETRDNMITHTQSGVVFMTAFNSVYYSFAPTVADWERQNLAFKEIVKTTITPLITTLSILNYVNIDSEAEMLGYGIGIILLNIGMYFVAPAAILTILRSRLSRT